MIPVVIATNGRGIPVRAVEENAPVMQVAGNGRGIPIVLSDLGAPFVVRGLDPVLPTLTVTDGTITTFTRGGVGYTQVLWRQGGSFTLTGDVPALWALGAGGGSGARSEQTNWVPGGGGAGGLLSGTTLEAGPYTVEIGAGGPSVTTGQTGNDGSPSVVVTPSGTLTAIGGGQGARFNNDGLGGDGGSGGGGRGANNDTFAGGSGTPGQGNDGGTGMQGVVETRTSAGGGGANGPGGDAQPNVPGAGGAGRLLDWMEPTVTVCRGGDGISSQTSADTPDQDWGCGSTGAINATAGKGGDGLFVLVVRSDDVVVEMET